ncbi:MAG TPA: DMT family transporter [Geminicoccaceae bacterium]|nr:DMT family transporter [Geminicoccaceae bacterium]
MIGLGAIGLWALLAPLGVLAGEVPPFLLTGLAFLVGGGLGLLFRHRSGRPLRASFVVPWPAWALGVLGLFGFHALYFTALRLLPPIEALLIVNLWPLLIVLLSALLPGERLLARHVAGALAGLLGTVLIVTAGAEAGPQGWAVTGYLCALGAALTWSSYSVLNRRLAAGVPSDAVTGFCLATAALALASHVLAEATVWPAGLGWLAVLALGLGPVGAAFYFWDHGTKHGDIQLLGAAAYASPVLGAVLLLLLGFGEPSLRLLAAAVLVLGGAAVASGDLWSARHRPAAG